MFQSYDHVGYPFLYFPQVGYVLFQMGTLGSKGAGGTCTSSPQAGPLSQHSSMEYLRAHSRQNPHALILLGPSVLTCSPGVLWRGTRPTQCTPSMLTSLEKMANRHSNKLAQRRQSVCLIAGKEEGRE